MSRQESFYGRKARRLLENGSFKLLKLREWKL